MDHRRAFFGTITVTGFFLFALTIWLVFYAPLAPDGNPQYEVVILVFGYAFVLGLTLLWSQRGTRADSRLYKHGHEGWATITSVRIVEGSAAVGELAEMEMQLTVPGAEPYVGRLVRPLDPYEKIVLVVGATVPVRVDPKDRDRIMLCL